MACGQILYSGTFEVKMGDVGGCESEMPHVEFLKNSALLCLCMCVYEWERVCVSGVCVCACVCVATCAYMYD